MRMLVAVLIAVSAVSVAAQLPPGVERFAAPASDIYQMSAAADGSVWIATTAGLYHMQPNGATTLVRAGFHSGVAVASNGNIWVADRVASQIFEITPANVVVSSYPFGSGGALELTFASDGALWYLTENVPSKVGRIFGGISQQFSLPKFVARIAAAPAGAIWALDFQFGELYRVAADGTVTTEHLPTTPSGGTLGPAPDGTLYIGDSDPDGLVKRSSGGAFSVIAPGAYLTGAFANGFVWIGTTGGFGVIANDVPRVTPILPPATPGCTYSRWIYFPETATPDGHVWVREAGIPSGTCPDALYILRVDSTQFLQAQAVAANAPALSTTGLMILIALLGALAVLKLRV